VLSICAKKQDVVFIERAGYEMLFQSIHWMCGELDFSCGPRDAYKDWFNGEEPNIQDYPLKGALAVTVHLVVPKNHGIVVLLRVVIGLVCRNSATNSTFTGRLPDFEKVLIRY
jgi:hypothetical protein